MCWRPSPGSRSRRHSSSAPVLARVGRTAHCSCSGTATSATGCAKISFCAISAGSRSRAALSSRCRRTYDNAIMAAGLMRYGRGEKAAVRPGRRPRHPRGVLVGAAAEGGGAYPQVRLVALLLPAPRRVSMPPHLSRFTPQRDRLNWRDIGGDPSSPRNRHQQPQGPQQSDRQHRIRGSHPGVESPRAHHQP